MKEILIVDDERTMREGLKATLLGEGFAVQAARNGEEALAKVAERRPDLVLLDVMMPRMNGFRCCEEIRRRDRLLPIVFLTAKETEADQVRGIGLGGDDYVAKATSDAILLARIRRALSRAQELAMGAARKRETSLMVGPVTVDLKTYTVLSRKGEILACLTKTEADILAFLQGHRGEWLVADDIITELRGNGYACEDAMLYVHMYNVRRKLGPAGALLVNKRGVGYALKADVV